MMFFQGNYAHIDSLPDNVFRFFATCSEMKCLDALIWFFKFHPFDDCEYVCVSVTSWHVFDILQCDRRTELMMIVRYVKHINVFRNESSRWFAMFHFISCIGRLWLCLCIRHKLTFIRHVLWRTHRHIHRRLIGET